MDKSETKIVYAYDLDGKLIGSKTLDWTDRSPVSGAWQLPAGTTEIVPPVSKDGYNLYFNDGAWQYVEQAKNEEVKQPSTATLAQQTYATVDSDLLNLAQAIADQEERLTKLEGGKTV